MKKIVEKIKKSVLIKRTTTILFMIILFAIFIGVTLWLNSLELDPIDFTQEKLYTLTQTSKDRLANVEDEVNIYFIGYSEEDAKIDLAKQYHNVNEKINVEVVTAADRPDLVQKYGIDDSSSGVIVENGEKVKVLSAGDFITYDMTTYEEIDITEEKLTNSILYVISEKNPTVYFLEGYSEFSVSKNMTYLEAFIENEITDHKTLNILTTGKVPDDCDTLIITSPTKDFDDIATKAITDYINKGGNILWFNAATAMKLDLPNVNKILALYGVKPFTIGYVNETDETRMMTDAPNVIVPVISYSTVTKNTASVLMINASKLNVVNDEELEKLKVTKTDLIKTTDTAYYRTDFTIQSGKVQASDEQGEFLIGAEFDKVVKEATEQDKEKVSKLVIYADNYFVSDFSVSQQSSYPLIQYASNRILAMDSIAYLVDRQEDLVIRKDVNTSTYTATVEQDNIIQAIIFGVPVAIIFAGILVWQHRRRKK